MFLSFPIWFFEVCKGFFPSGIIQQTKLYFTKKCTIPLPLLDDIYKDIPLSLVRSICVFYSTIYVSQPKRKTYRIIDFKCNIKILDIKHQIFCTEMIILIPFKCYNYHCPYIIPLHPFEVRDYLNTSITYLLGGVFPCHRHSFPGCY